MAEHTIIINNLVKNPPAEKLRTNIMPPKSSTAKITAPHKRPVFRPSRRRLLAAVKLAAKHPEHRAMLESALNVPSLKSTTDAAAENSVTARKIAPTQAKTELIIIMLRSARIRSAGVFRRIKIPPSHIFSKAYAGRRQKRT